MRPVEYGTEPVLCRTQPLTAVLYHRNGNNEWVQQYCSVLEQLPSGDLTSGLHSSASGMCLRGQGCMPLHAGLEASWHVQFKLLESQDFRVLITAADGQQQLTGGSPTGS